MKFGKTIVLGGTAAAALAVAAVQAQSITPQLPGTKDPTQVTAGIYAVDPAHTLVGWDVNHFGFNDYFGLFGNVTGTLVLDPDALSESSVIVNIPVAEVTVANEGLRNHLLRDGKDGAAPDFFGANPAAARFVSTRIIPGDDRDEATIEGNLTLNGVTRQVTLSAEFTGAGTNPFNKKETVGFEAEGKIRRSDFGINYGLPLVSDEVELEITAAFEKN